MASSPLSVPLPPPLAGERAAVTGTLASMTHARAMDLIRENGGIVTDRVSGQTTLLIVGEEGWALDDEGHPSVDFRRAETFRQSGTGIRIVSETDFLRFVGLAAEDAGSRLYTPAKLRRLLGLAPGVVRRWERLGLICPARKVGRLPYFDFREVTRLRRLAELLADGVPKERLEASLRLLTGDDRATTDLLSRLDLLADGGRVFARDRSGVFQPGSGQRLFDFDPGHRADASGDEDETDDPNATPLKFPAAAPLTAPADWQDRALDLLDAGEVPDAVAAFREAVRLQPDAAELHYGLADALYRAGSAAAALERFRVATEWDPDYVEAWTQMGALHLECREPAAARECLQRSVDLFADNPDALIHLADACEQLGDETAAGEHRSAFLAIEPNGPWSDEVRAKL